MRLFAVDLDFWLVAASVQPGDLEAATTSSAGPGAGVGIFLMAAGIMLYISCLYARTY